MMLWVTLGIVVVVGTWAAIVSLRSFRADDLGQMSDDWSPK